MALTEDSEGLLYGPDRSHGPEQRIKFEPGETPLAWTPEGKAVYLFESDRRPPTITRFEDRLRPTPVVEGGPGVGCAVQGQQTAITPDGRSYAITYGHEASDLYLVRGLK